jgi:hypothetical protein
VTQVEIMAKKLKGDQEAEPKKRVRLTAPVQIAGDLAHMVGVICAHDDVTQSELLSPVVRDFVEKNYRRVQQEIAERVRRMDAGG